MLKNIGILSKANRSLISITARGLANMTTRRGLVLGVFTENNNQKDTTDKKDEKEKPLTVENFTLNANAFNKRTNGALIHLLNCSEPLKAGKCRVFYGLDQTYNAIAVAGLGKKGAEIDVQEQWHMGKENVRAAMAVGTKALREIGCRSIDIDSCDYPQCAAEGAVMSTFVYDELKSTNSENKKGNIEIKLYEDADVKNTEAALEFFNTGVILAEGQNLCRKLMEMPANLLTPVRFAEIAQELSKETKNFEVIARDKAWAEQEKMYSFLSVAQGSIQPPVFLEIHYKSKGANSEKAPFVLVGKGVCFDSGGISLKPSSNMDKMRADMGGAANVLTAMYTLSRLGVELPYNVIGLIPLVENMPGGKATKPGDVVFAKNGKSIKIDNTDAEGRLILADALCYADSFKPAHVVDLATLTGAMVVSLGTTAAGVFCTNDELWQQILTSSVDVGDRVWRMPLFKAYNAKMKSDCADLNNILKGSTGAGSCAAAGFLKEFIECKSWAHIDIAGVMEADGDLPYIPKGMSGRPMRMLVHMLTSLDEN